MAVIQSGDSTDQLHIDTHKSAQVTLADAAGSAVTPLVNGGNVVVSNFPASQAVTAAALPLPSGAATETGHLASIDTKLTSPLAVTGAFFPATQPVSAAVLPLPAGAATDATLTARLPLAANAALAITPVDGAKATYAAGIASLALPAAATDVCVITGSATKTIRVVRVCLSFIATTAISVPVSLVKRSTANTGGTSAIQTATALDSANAAATAVLRTYTANAATLGTLVGTVLAAGKVAAPLTGGVEPLTVLDFGIGPRQAVVLRGVGESLCINLNGATVLGGNAALSMEWTEET